MTVGIFWGMKFRGVRSARQKALYWTSEHNKMHEKRLRDDVELLHVSYERCMTASGTGFTKGPQQTVVERAPSTHSQLWTKAPVNMHNNTYVQYTNCALNSNISVSAHKRRINACQTRDKESLFVSHMVVISHISTNGGSLMQVEILTVASCIEMRFANEEIWCAMLAVS